MKSPPSQYRAANPTAPAATTGGKSTSARIPCGVSILTVAWAADGGPESARKPDRAVVKWSTAAYVRAQYLRSHPGASEPAIQSRIDAQLVEARFYRQVLPRLVGQPELRLPTVLAVDSTPGKDGHTGIVMALEPGIATKDPLGPAEISAAIAAAAAFHGASWVGRPLHAELVASGGWDRPGCFWTADKQIAPEPGQLERAWSGVLHRLGRFGLGSNQAVSATCPVADGDLDAVGARMDAVQAAVSAHLAGPELGRQTFTHGDFKLANLLWAAERPEHGHGSGPPLVIDWEWAGPGPAAQDLAYLLASSAHVGCLEAGADEELLAEYHQRLPAAARHGYPLATLVQDYELALLDLLRCVAKAAFRSTPTRVPD